MKRTKRIMVVFLALVLTAGIMAGCSAKKTDTATATAPGSASMADVNTVYSGKADRNASAYQEAEGYSNEYKAAQYAADGIIGTGFSGSYDSTVSNAALDILAQRKVIRNANLSVEVDDFYASYGALQTMIKGIGYVSESNIHRDYYTYDGERKARITGEITIRVAARHFDDILTDIKGLGEVIDDRIYSTDVTDQYFDTEGRLKVLKIEYEFLEEYMKSLKTPEDIFKTRMRMTELQSEIEKLTGTLNKWDDLVELSTIYVKITEKYPDSMYEKKEYTYWDRVANAFKESVAGVVEALGNLLIFIIQAIPTLVVLGIFGLIAYRIYKKIVSKRESRNSKSKAGSAERSEDRDN